MATNYTPTRKVTAAAITGIIAAALTSWLSTMSYTTSWLSFLNTTAVSEAIPVIAALIAAYMIKDK